LIDTAIIVAGGLGTRLRPLTENTPKPLLPVHGKPIIEHALLNLKKHGVTNFILSIGYKADLIKDYFQNGEKWGVNITYAIEDTPLGTGGAVKLAAKGLLQPFFLTWGDNLMDVDFSRMREEYQEHSTPIIMTLTPREDVEHFGVAELNEHKIINFVEKPPRHEAPSNLINAGAFIIDPFCLDMLPEGKSSIEKDCFEKLAPLGNISAFTHPGQWFPTDTLEKYYHANSNFNADYNIKHKKIIICDVDETICETCQVVSDEMANQINIMIKSGYEFAFISGTKVTDLQKMLSSKIKERHHILATTGTNYTYMENNMGSCVYNLKFKDEEKQEIIQALNNTIEHFNIVSMTTHEDQLQDRDSQITLSAIGRNAPIELKKAYDPDGEIRQTWKKFLKDHLDQTKYDIKIGGTTSLDVTKKGLDKEWGIKEFCQNKRLKLNQVLFFGDKIYPGGNDFPATKIVDCVSVKNPDETLKKLKEIAKITTLAQQ
jgi:HAD superfamily hydrolase (TIGR01484 family)